MIKLSILICSLHSRKSKLQRLLNVLQPQINKHKDVECLIAADEKEIKIGTKRNLLISQAKGTYIVFIDDDDLVSENYIEKILEKTTLSPDVIVFDLMRFANGKQDRQAKFGIEFKSDSNTKECYYRIPNHLMPVKKEIALQVPFKQVNFGEDADYAKRILPLLKTQERINETLYTYLYNDK